jgi:glycolate oxidase
MVIDELKKIVGDKYLFSGVDIDPGYGRDQSPYAGFEFDLLVKPGTVAETAGVARVCNQWRVPLTIRGGGTGVTGGALPVHGGVVLSTERLNRIITIDRKNRYAVVEAGVVTKSFCDALEACGMYFPVVPGSSGSSFIGGNLAVNAGSPRSCKYGTIDHQVLNLELVLANGAIIETGANVYKNAAGFNITRLLVGSQGMLGIITKAVLKILPLPRGRRTFLAGFRHLESAINVCHTVAASGIRPSAVELITEGAIRLARPLALPGYPMFSPGLQAQVLIELEDDGIANIDWLTDWLAGILKSGDAEDIIMGTTEQEGEVLWSLRNRIGEAMTRHNLSYRDIDSCVPPARLFEFLQAVDEMGEKYGHSLVIFGHAMDGNIHTMLLFQKDGGAKQDADKLLACLYGTVVRLGGTITGEHGVGLLQRDWQPLQFPRHHLELLIRVKEAFDPRQILNPGKLMPEIVKSVIGD